LQGIDHCDFEKYKPLKKTKMKNYNSTDGKTSQQEDFSKALTEINVFFKKEATRNMGLFLLNEIDSSLLTPKQYLMFCFLKGKHLSLIYKSSGKKNAELLNEASNWLDELVQCAFESKVKILQEYYYLRLKIKYSLVQVISEDSKRNRMVASLQFLTEQALGYYPKHTGLLMIHKTLES
jgi:hypothetical protein